MTRLTSFAGTTIGYNTMGCPTTYEGKTATWSKGKLSRLSSGTRLAGMASHSYSYNGYGQRVSRSYSYTAGTSGLNPVPLGQLTASSRKYYYDHSGRLIAEDVIKTYYGEGTTTENIVFLYDESGIIGMVHTVGTTANTYYFQRNLQGDVVAIYDSYGSLKAKYLYDAWGNCTISSETTSYDVANANPIRYRGYYYDDDTGLYFCNARYYSPKWRRFISPDDTAYLDPASVNGLNLYCYCGNDPINIVDTVSGKSVVANQNGTYPHTSASKLVGSANQFNLPKLPWLISNATTLYGTYSAISAGIPIFAHYFRYAKTIGDEFRLYGISKWRTSLQLADVNLKMTKLDGFLLGINVGLDIYDSIQRGVSLGGVALGAGLTAASGVGMLYLNKGIMWACTTVGTAISPGLGTAIGFVVGLAVSIVVDIWLGNALSEWIDQIAT